MYLEELVPTIKSQPENLGNFYMANLGLIYKLGQDLSVSASDYDDFKQLCYFAMLDAINGYTKGAESSLTSYFRMCVKSLYYRYCLQTKYPVTLTQYFLNKAREDNTVPQYVSFSDLPYSTYYLDKVETLSLYRSLWKRISEVLSKENTFVLVLRYKHDNTFKEIGCALGIGAERARLRHNRSLKRLGEDVVICEIAQALNII